MFCTVQIALNTLKKFYAIHLALSMPIFKTMRIACFTNTMYIALSTHISYTQRLALCIHTFNTICIALSNTYFIRI